MIKQLLILVSFLFIVLSGCQSNEQYTITFESNEGTLVTSITQDYETNVSAPAAPTKVGYDFGGWYKDVALTEAYRFNTMPSENITLYAKWVIEQYDVQFYLDENEILAIKKYDKGSKINTKLDFFTEELERFFLGWYTDVNLTDEYDVNQPINQDLILYAKLMDVNLWLLNFAKKNFSVNSYSSNSFLDRKNYYYYETNYS
jgi:uncharacterized repeat protein (TIGR02543 family)